MVKPTNVANIGVMAGFELPVTAGVAALFDAALSRGEGALDVVAAARIAT